MEEPDDEEANDGDQAVNVAEVDSDAEKDDSQVAESDEDVKIVNRIVFAVSLVIAAMFIALIIYFFIMRSKTIQIAKHLTLTKQRKGLDSPTSSPGKTMSLISFDRMSPEKVMPMPYPVTEQMDQVSKRNSRPGSSGGSIMNMVKM